MIQKLLKLDAKSDKLTRNWNTMTLQNLKNLDVL